jgi:hypothetical protein
MSRDLQSEFQARLVVATFEITNGLVVDLDCIGQLPARYALLGAKDSDSVM